MSQIRASTTFISVNGSYVPTRSQVAPIARDVLHRDADGPTIVDFCNRVLHIVDQGLQAFRTAPDATKTLFVGGPQLTFTAHQVTHFPHLLGRSWLGYQVISDQGVAWNGFATHAAPSPGITSLDAVYIALTAGSNAGTFSLLVW